MSNDTPNNDGPQMPLPLTHRIARGREAFLVSQSNAMAVAWIDKWPEWPQPLLVLAGPQGSGKSHLADVWRTRANALIGEAADLTGAAVPALLQADALVLENIHRTRDHAALFHLLNFARENTKALLLTSARTTHTLGFPLADLASRLNAAPQAVLDEPDDALLIQLIAKLFDERGVHVGADMIDYIIKRIDRSAAAARDAVERIDRHALSHTKRLNIGVLREVLA